MDVVKTALTGLCLLTPKVFGDARGEFFVPYDVAALEPLGMRPIVQINQSVSAKGVLRGMHYQAPPYAQQKLVRCTRGAVYDVAIDIRRGSPTFGGWSGFELSETNRRMLYVPEGFAHGFYALTEGCVVEYAVGGSRYEPSAERGVYYNDPFVGIAWPLIGPPLVHPRDIAFPPLSPSFTPFFYEGDGT